MDRLELISVICGIELGLLIVISSLIKLGGVRF